MTTAPPSYRREMYKWKRVIYGLEASLLTKNYKARVRTKYGWCKAGSLTACGERYWSLCCTAPGSA
jgi:hypothetical protein